MDDYAFATVDEYRVDTGDMATDEERVAAELSRQSAKLRATLGMPRYRSLAGDARELHINKPHLYFVRRPNFPAQQRNCTQQNQYKPNFAAVVFLFSTSGQTQSSICNTFSHSFFTVSSVCFRLPLLSMIKSAY